MGSVVLFRWVRPWCAVAVGLGAAGLGAVVTAAPAQAQLGAVLDGLLRPPPRYYAPPPPAYYPPPGYVYRPAYPPPVYAAPSYAAPAYVAPRVGVGAGTVVEAQRMLGELGYDPGPADGAFGRRVADALRNFQHDHGLRVDGRLTADAMGDLRSVWRDRDRASVKRGGGGDGDVANVKSKPSAPAAEDGGAETIAKPD